MIFNRILKTAAITAITAFSLLFTANAVLADYLSSEGGGGNYRYELWSDGNNGYYLKIWREEASKNSAPYRVSGKFDSSREALVYFDCYYAEKSLPECPR